MYVFTIDHCVSPGLKNWVSRSFMLGLALGSDLWTCWDRGFGLGLDNLQVISGTSNILMHTNLSSSNEPLKCLFFSLTCKKFLRDLEIGHVKHVTHKIVFNNNFETVNFG